MAQTGSTWWRDESGVSTGRRRGEASSRVSAGSAASAARRPAEARNLLVGLIHRDPHNAIAHFNLGLLFRDYEPNPAQSAYHLRRYLETADLATEQNLFRRIQAEFWLSEYEPAGTGTASTASSEKP